MSDTVTIIGAGWAGLTAAVILSQNNIPVRLLESAAQPGGRARRIEYQGMALDNGQHLLLGAYEHTLSLLAILGIEEHQVLARLPVRLHMRSPKGGEVLLKTPHLPAPFHLLIGLLGARGLSLRDKGRTLRRLAQMLRWQQTQDLSVQTLLERFEQPTALIRALWEPLCIAALNTPMAEASARVFVRVLNDAFGKRRRHSQMLIAKTDLGAVLPWPAVNFIRQHRGEVRLGTRVKQLQARDKGWQLTLADETLNAQELIIATAAHAAVPLLQAHPSLQAIVQGLQQLTSEPICTVYLRYPTHVRLPEPAIGLLDTLGQWVFDRRMCGQAGLMAVVISAGGAHMALSNTQLIAALQSEIASLFPHWPAPLSGYVIREKRATFKCIPGCETLRPDTRTPIDALYLAGDYTRTGLPATLEGAVQSGIECARHIMRRRQGEHEIC